MKKQLNPLQPLIDEMHQNKKLHSQLAKNAENENNRYNNNYVHFEKGVAYGFELAIEILAKFNFWNDARTNPPKFDKNRAYPDYPLFFCIVLDYENCHSISTCCYDFATNEWKNIGGQVAYWQEYSIMPKELLK